MESFAVKAQIDLIKSEIWASNWNTYNWVTTEWNASELSFYFFCFQTVDTNVKKLFTSVHTKLNSKRLQRNSPEKGILISLQSHFKLIIFQKKSLKLMNLRVWYMGEWNSVVKSFPTISERWSRSFFHLCKSKVFKI